MNSSFSYLHIALTILVLLAHSIFIYSGGWGPAVAVNGSEHGISKIFGMIARVTSPFAMGTFFFLSGWKLPYSFRNRNLINFIWVRALRYWVPVLVWIYALGPGTVYLTHNIPWEFRTREHLWFCSHLVMFHGVFLFFCEIMRGKKLILEIIEEGPQKHKIYAGLVVSGLLLSAVTFFVRCEYPIGFVKDYLAEVAYFPWYFFAFNSGIIFNILKVDEALNLKNAGVLCGFAGLFLIVTGIIFSDVPKGQDINQIAFSVLETGYLISSTFGIFFLTNAIHLKTPKLIVDISKATYLVYIGHAVVLFAVCGYLPFWFRGTLLYLVTFICCLFLWVLAYFLMKIKVISFIFSGDGMKSVKEDNHDREIEELMFTNEFMI